MSTQFFYSLTPERILDAVEKIGVRCTGRLLQLNSMENRVYEAEIELGSVLPQSRVDSFRVVKFYRPGRWTRDQILEEHRFLFDLKNNDISVIAPLPFPDTGESLRELEDTSIWYAAFPKGGGRTLDELSDDQLKRIGRLVARLHTIGAGRVLEHRLSLTVDTFATQSLEYLASSAAIPSILVPRYTQIVESICVYARSSLEGITLQRIHGDLHSGNILWDREQCSVVDFDDMLRGPCVQDLWLLVPGRDDDAKRRWEVLISGYDQMRSFDHSELCLVEVLRTLRIIYFSAWIARRWEDPAFQRTFTSFGGMEYWRDQLNTLEEQLEILSGQRGAYG